MSRCDSLIWPCSKISALNEYPRSTLHIQPEEDMISYLGLSRMRPSALIQDEAYKCWKMKSSRNSRKCGCRQSPRYGSCYDVTSTKSLPLDWGAVPHSFEARLWISLPYISLAEGFSFKNRKIFEIYEADHNTRLSEIRKLGRGALAFALMRVQAKPRKSTSSSWCLSRIPDSNIGGSIRKNFDARQWQNRFAMYS